MLALEQTDINSLLGPDGEFSRRIPGYTQRPQQAEMAMDVARALAGRQQLLVEAGTGTGKTLAYLIPAMLASGRTLVSTGTKTLQDQLFYKDIPLVRGAIAPMCSVALLKGRGNYLCPYRLDKHLQTMVGHASPELLADLQRIRQWQSRSATGDLTEVLDMEAEGGLLGLITSSVDNCLGHECPKFDECPVYRARTRAAEADLVVINHHLLFADMAMQEDDLASLLPTADHVIIDEAHQVADIARQFFGTHVSSGQFVELCRDCRTELVLLGNDDPALAARVGVLEDAVSRLQGSVATVEAASFETLVALPGVAATVEAVDMALGELATMLEVAKERSRQLANCHQRAVRLLDKFAMLTEPGEWEDDYAQWIQVRDRGFIVHLTPVSIAEQLGAQVRESGKSWVLTSATLTVNDRFDHIRSSLGLTDAIEQHYPSPYDYDAQVRGWIPAGLPRPGDDVHTRSLVAACLPVLQRVTGRTFFLCTSYRALNVAAACLTEAGLSCLVQGQMSRTAMLERFRSVERCVLLATYSFWEGVDVRGADLQCLIIDKLPFANPDDPLSKATAERIRQLGGNAFMDYLVPEAAIKLRQGFGRLVREDADRGLFVLGDPRVVYQAYGRIFRASLPSFPWLESREEAIDFVEGLAAK